MIDQIGWFGNIFFILGAIFLAKKKVAGFYCNVFGNIAYVIQGILVGTASLWVLSILLCWINLYGIRKWRNIKWIVIKN